jgi:hypothetical protein
MLQREGAGEMAVRPFALRSRFLEAVTLDVIVVVVRS